MYKKYSDNDLIIAYSTMMATSGKLSSDLADEIEKRGGLEFFKRKLALRKSHPEEVSRLTKEIQSLTTPETDWQFVRTLLNSDFMSKEDLDIFVKNVFDEFKSISIDKKITKDVIIKSLIGFFAGSIISGLFWWGILYMFHEPFIFLIPLVFIIGHLIIKIITKRSAKNRVVLASSILSAVFGLMIGHFLNQAMLG